MTEEFCRCEHGKSFHGHKGYRCQYRIDIKRGHPKKQCGCIGFVPKRCKTCGLLKNYYCRDPFHDTPTAPRVCPECGCPRENPEFGCNDTFHNTPASEPTPNEDDPIHRILIGGLTHNNLGEAFWSVVTDYDFGAMAGDHEDHVKKCIATLLSVTRAESDARVTEAFKRGADWINGHINS